MKEGGHPVLELVAKEKYSYVPAGTVTEMQLIS
jgi:hypothetical protein